MLVPKFMPPVNKLLKKLIVSFVNADVNDLSIIFIPPIFVVLVDDPKFKIPPIFVVLVDDPKFKIPVVKLVKRLTVSDADIELNVLLTTVKPPIVVVHVDDPKLRLLPAINEVAIFKVVDGEVIKVV